MILSKGIGIPAIRQIYTLSFVFMTAGLAILLLTTLYIVTDIWKKRRGTGWLLLYGSCSLVTWELSVFCLRGVDEMARRISEGMPVLLGTERYQPVFIGFWEVVIITVLVIIWYNAKRCAEMNR